MDIFLKNKRMGPRASSHWAPKTATQSSKTNNKKSTWSGLSCSLKGTQCHIPLLCNFSPLATITCRVDPGLMGNPRGRATLLCKNLCVETESIDTIILIHDMAWTCIYPTRAWSNILASSISSATFTATKPLSSSITETSSSWCSSMKKRSLHSCFAMNDSFSGNRGLEGASPAAWLGWTVEL